MKAIYVKIGKNVYRVNQNTNPPGSLTFKSSGVSTTLDIDKYNKVVTQNIYINNLQRPGVKTNKEMFNELVYYLKTRLITSIKTIQNFFRVYIDYTVYVDDKEIDRCSVIRPIEPVDKAVVLGVATNNELVYRRVKTFNPTIDFKIKNPLPFGIMQNQKEKYVLKINNVALFQDFSDEPEIHESTYEVSYDIPSSTVDTSFDNSKMVYSTESLGIDIKPITLPFMPRMVSVALDITLADYIVAYDNKEIDKILLENIDAKYPTIDDNPSTPEDPDDPGTLLPDKDDRPDADGDFTPDDDGYYDYYERCRETTPHALLVVEDGIPDSKYNLKTMIKISKIKADIKDIEVGEYVVYRESFNNII